MSKEALLPCIVCGKRLDAEFGNIAQPSEGTEFQTYGHYGSTFWDSFHGEELVLNVCDECLRKNTDKLARHKRYRNLVVAYGESASFRTYPPVLVGRQWIDQEMVPYFDGPEDSDDIEIEADEIGELKDYARIEWVADWQDIKKAALAYWTHRDMLDDLFHEVQDGNKTLDEAAEELNTDAANAEAQYAAWNQAREEARQKLAKELGKKP